MEKTLSPTDPPILLAGLLAARKSGDKLLAEVFTRELRERGIEIRFPRAKDTTGREPLCEPRP
jgi:hypothetical protein